MLFSSFITSPRSSLSLRQTVDLAKAYLNVASNTNDLDIALVLCYDTEVSLHQARISAEPAEDQSMISEIASIYTDLGNLLERHGHGKEAKASYRQAGRLGANIQDPGHLTKTDRPSTIANSVKGPSASSSRISQTSGSAQSPLNRERRRTVTIPSNIFTQNARPPAIEYKLPQQDERLSSTPQLAACLYLIQGNYPLDDTLDPTTHEWLNAIEEDTDEQNRLRTMATEVIRVFKRDEIKDAKVVAEVTYLAPVLDKDTFQDLLSEFYSGIDHSGLLKFHLLEGLAQLIQGGDQSHLSADDLVKILGLLSNRLRDTHQQSSEHIHQLTLAVSHVLDAMADTKVNDLNRETLHEPLSAYLDELKKSKDPYLVYQAAYAFQALQWVPDNEAKWQSVMRRTRKVIQGVCGLVSAVKGLDLIKFIDGLSDIQKGFSGASKVVKIVKNAYDDAVSLTQSGKRFLDSLKEGFSFERKRDWYPALRGADVLIRDGDLVSFRKLVCEAPCQLDPAFQWGVCQRLGQIAANSTWDVGTRRSAIALLGEIYRNDDVWGQNSSVKKWIINILMQLASLHKTVHTTAAESLLRELESSGDKKKQALYQVCRDKGPIPYPLRTCQPELPSPSLLDRALNRPYVEGNIRPFKKRRITGRGHAVYIPPQAKASIQADDGTRFQLMEKVMEFLDSDRRVFLLLGDSGSGKSTFNRELEFELWQSYKNGTGRIPLYVNLPAIDKPEQDIITKQLRKADFTEPQIREMKDQRKFILICDGYDECQQTQNLYMSNRLNQPGEWDAQMVITCRTEYLGTDYRHRFQPGDRNQPSDSSLFQEAVITPFSLGQVHDYIKQYVILQQPLWTLDDYKQALELAPSLKELVKNPFLMTLSLDVLPRIVTPGQNHPETRVTRVELYDHFVEQWLERGKKRIGERELNPQTRAAFECLVDEGFTRNGIEYLKKLAVAIYKEQDGLPIVEYSRSIDEGSWKDQFFGRDEEKQLLREACPLTRNGNQHRFIHRSLLEYGLARAVFDPQDRRTRATGMTSEPPMGRRGSVGSNNSAQSFKSWTGSSDEEDSIHGKDSDTESPLVWMSIVNDHSILQFLEERVRQEPDLKEQLLDYIERSKKDKKWRQAAANAITILIRAGEKFIGANLQGIQIPGADLSNGVFDSVDLYKADLREVNLRGVWLRQADLGETQMTGVQFGGLPDLADDSEIFSCTYSPDGKSIAVGSLYGDISVYSTSSWERTRTLRGHTNLVSRVAYSPTGDKIASVSYDMTVRLWDMDTGSQLHALGGHTGYVSGVAYSPQGDMVASGSDDMAVRIWDVISGDCRKVLCGHTGEVTGIAYSPSGYEVVSCSEDTTIRLWDVETGQCNCILSGHSDIVADVAYSPHGDQIASASSDKTVRVWDAKTGAGLHILNGHTDTVCTVAFSPQGGQVTSGSLDSTLRFWDTETGSCRHISTSGRGAVRALSYSPKGDTVASGDGNGTLRLWNASTGASHLIACGTTVQSIGYSPKRDFIVSGNDDSTIHLRDMETGMCCRTLRGHTGAVLSVDCTPHGNLIASGCGNKSVRLWKMDSGECQHILTGHTDCINCVMFSPEGNIIASASSDNTVRLWDVMTGDCRGILSHPDGVMTVAFSPYIKQIATGSKDCAIRLWDVESGVCSKILEGHTDWVRQVVYSPLGNQLASASNDRTIRLWELEGGSIFRLYFTAIDIYSRLTLTGHTNQVCGIAYSASGKLLASGSLDKTVRLWDASSGECRAEVKHFPDYVNCVAWCASSDVSYLVTGCHDGAVLKWEVIEEKNQSRIGLQWAASNGALNVAGACIQDAHGLTALDMKLLKQRGAIDRREHTKALRYFELLDIKHRRRRAVKETTGRRESSGSPPYEAEHPFQTRVKRRASGSPHEPEDLTKRHRASGSPSRPNIFFDTALEIIERVRRERLAKREQLAAPSEPASGDT
ncbi:hypothetical protein BGX34_002416 [Mortierella sp. NVP85]|nr:hypothetical protein BGX34_002416 [Mortierella sp. NVP85]